MNVGPHPHLDHPPIVEGLLDIRVELPPATTLAEVQKIQPIVAHQFPTRKERLSFESTFQMGA